MIVVGGVYREECVVPYWSRIFGSGGRAAAALAGRSQSVALHAYAGRAWADDVAASFSSQGVTPFLRVIENDIVFRYFHPMSTADLTGRPAKPEESLAVEGDAVLRFGFVEGDAIVRACQCVFDPQHASQALAFGDNSSRADRLAIVLNESELRFGVDADEAVAIAKLREAGAEAIVVKRGARGATVHVGETTHAIAARLTPEVFKIGSGDVFSAVFAHHWAERGDAPVDAAEAASHAAAAYVTTRDATVQSSTALSFPPAPRTGQGGPIYVAGPFFHLGQRWMVEQARDALTALGAQAFSPLHDVGTVGSSKAMAEADLEGLRRCRSVLALVDGEDAGTLFEIGYARQRGIPVVALAENPRPEALTMLEGSGCHIARDFTSAIYHALWAALT